MRTPRPIVSSTVTATPMTEDLTVRNLIHSARVDAINVDSLATGGVPLLRTVLDGARGEVHEDLLERRALRRQFENGDARVEGELSDLVRRQTSDGQAVVAGVVHDAVMRHDRSEEHTSELQSLR